MTASSLYAACRTNVVPITLDDVAAACGVKRKFVARYYRLLVRELEMEIPLAHSAEYLPAVASRAGMNADVRARALGMLHKAEEGGVVDGWEPMSLAASVLYLGALAQGQKLTQKGAAAAAGVTLDTIRNQVKRLRVVLAE